MLTGSANVISLIIVVLAIPLGGLVAHLTGMQAAGGLTIAAGVILAGSPRIIREWERGVLLRLGKYRRLLKPGISWVIPGLDSVVERVDMRIRATPFSAEKTLTRDTVPVNVDAVLFWEVDDAKRAVLEVEGFQKVISWAAQTTLRDVIGKTELVRMIADRAALDAELQTIIDHKAAEWGIRVQSVELRDVRIPSSLEDAMSRKAQADREKEARIILAESEAKVALEMARAAEIYDESTHAMQLRAMNMTYESIKERGALMVIPSGMASSMDPGIVGLAAAGFERVPPPPKPTSQE